MSDLSKIIGRDFDKKKGIPQVKLDFSKLDLSGVDKFTKDIVSDLEEISKDIVRKQDNAKAMEFTKVVGTMLRENGVTPIIAEYKRNFVNEKSFETRYGFGIERLDFTEHDKVFEDRISKLIAEKNKCIEDNSKLEKDIKKKKKAFDDKNNDYMHLSSLISTYQSDNDSLQKRIAELEEDLEGKETEIEIPLTPIEVAKYLINHTTHADAVLFLPERDVNTFSVDELEQIAEHLLVYCKHNRESE